MIELKILNKEFYLYNYDLPRFATEGSAAIDLIATEDVLLSPQEAKKIPTGLAMHIGSGYTNVAGFILPRSGLGHDKGLVLGNLVGLMDEDYQGEIVVSAWNRNERPYDYQYVNHIIIKRGQRFAQLIFLPIIKPDFWIVDEFSQSSDRGEGGFGSTN